MKMEKNSSGFTLIELLIVIAIIGTLSGVVLVSLSGARAKARDAIRQSDMRQIVSAQGVFYGFNEGYFTAVRPDDGGTPFIGRYLSSLHDPQCPGDNCTDYEWVTNTGNLTCTNNPNLNSLAGEWFCIYAILEEKSLDPNNTIYFCASQRGTKKLDSAALPSVTVDCTCF
jgi:prepilin-type N-terminal cleavage/methylation domain-containing protein